MKSIHNRFELKTLTDIEEKVAMKEKLIGSPGHDVLLYAAVKAIAIGEADLNADVKLEEGEHSASADEGAVGAGGDKDMEAVVPMPSSPSTKPRRQVASITTPARAASLVSTIAIRL